MDDVESTYDVFGVVAYNFDLWDQHAMVFARYRYLDLHYDDGSVDLKLTVKGPLVGFGFEF